MFRNYLNIAVRNLFKHRLYSAINIFGLAVGLASCILIMLFVRDELSYDRWIPNAENVYRLHTRFDIPGREPMFAQTSPGPAMAALKKDFPDVETGVRLLNERPVIHRGTDLFFEEVILADASFFDVFDLPLLEGDRATALAEPNGMLISESMAKKHFGNKSPVGEVLTVTYYWGEREVRITGVLKDLPDNTHLEINFLGHLHEPDYDKYEYVAKSWTSMNIWTYVKLKPGADVSAIQKQLSAFEERNVPSISMGGQDFKVADFMELSLHNLVDLHLNSRGLGDMKPGGDKTAVATFSVVAALILLIACINFTNLATARASQRAREVALRKVLGAHRNQLIGQFLGESVLLALIALLVAIGIVELVLPTYGNFLDKDLTLSYFGANGVALELAGLVLLVGGIGGVYPALYLSRFMPARILKANKSAAAEGSGKLRSALVVLQFAISIGLIICTAVVYSQTIYARTMDLGFDKSGLLSVRGVGREAAEVVQATIKEEMRRIPGVTAVSLSQETPGEDDESNNIIEIPGQVSADPIVIGTAAVDYDFFNTVGTPVIAGRMLSQDHGADDFTGENEEQAARGGNIVINRQTLKRIGVATPEEAVGKVIRMSVGDDENGQDLMATMTIVGVVENAQWTNARKEIRPMLYYYDSKGFNFILARMRNAEPAQIRSAAESVWRELVPTQPFYSVYVEEELSKLYNADEARGQMFAAFAGLAIIIACLGLFGLASFTAERRTKEIGIRKVLGARVRDVVKLLAWDFSKPVLIANVIAWPAAWWLMRDWLNGFQNRVDLDPTIFVVAGTLALAVALATVASHAARVARSNPIHALRYE